MPRTAEYTHEQVIDKALDLFWNRGFNNVTIDDLVQATETNKSLIYNKYGKKNLFLDSIEEYVSRFTDPTMKYLEESDEGIQSIRNIYYGLVDALLDKTFPRSCLMINTVVEFGDTDEDIVQVYENYFSNVRKSFTKKLNYCFEIGEISDSSKFKEYVELLMGMPFSLSILYRVRSKEELYAFVDAQIDLII